MQNNQGIIFWGINQLHILKIALIVPINSKKKKKKNNNNNKEKEEKEKKEKEEKKKKKKKKNCISEDKSCPAKQEIINILQIINSHYRAHKSPSKFRYTFPQHHIFHGFFLAPSSKI